MEKKNIYNTPEMLQQMGTSTMRPVAQVVKEINEKIGEPADGQAPTLFAAIEETKQNASKLAVAITSKGVPTSKTDSLDTMADHVLLIPQQLNTKESDFGSFVAPSEYMWNVFEIARDLQSDNPHPEMGAFFVAEYYRGYDSLVLTGADAYLTCDGDYYAPLDKSVEVTHVWHDADNGKSNRYVVFYYMQDGYTFANANASICPRRVALSGRCASFIVTGENRLTDVYVLGTLEHFEGGTTGTSWNPAQVIRNYREHSSGNLYSKFEGSSCVLPELQVINGGTLFANNVCPHYISMPSLTTINQSTLFNNVGDTSAYNSLEFIDMPELVSCYSIFRGRVTSTNVVLEGIKEIRLPKLKNALSYLFYTTTGGIPYFMQPIKAIYLDSIEHINFPIRYNYGFISNNSTIFPNLEKIYMPNLKTAVADPIYGTNNNTLPCLVKLIDIEVGEMESDFNMRRWDPTDVLSTPEGIATINANIRDHIAAKVSDRTGLSARTFTVSTNLYNNLEPETIAAFTAKNWNVAGA